jgi:hypothetical protein
MPIRKSLLLEHLNTYANRPGEIREDYPLFQVLNVEVEPKKSTCDIFADDKTLFYNQEQTNKKKLEDVDEDLAEVDIDIKNVESKIKIIEDEMKEKNCPITKGAEAKGGQAKDDKSYSEDKMTAQDEKLSQNDCKTINKTYEDLEEDREKLVKEETELIKEEEGLLAFKDEIQENIKEINIKINNEPSCQTKGGKRKTRKQNKKRSYKKRSSKRKTSSKKRKATRRKRR